MADTSLSPTFHDKPFLPQDGCARAQPIMQYLDCRLMASNCSVLPAVDKAGQWIRRGAGEACCFCVGRSGLLACALCFPSPAMQLFSCSRAHVQGTTREGVLLMGACAAAVGCCPWVPPSTVVTSARASDACCRLPAQAAAARTAGLHNQTRRGAQVVLGRNGRQQAAGCRRRAGFTRRPQLLGNMDSPTLWSNTCLPLMLRAMWPQCRVVQAARHVLVRPAPSLTSFFNLALPLPSNPTAPGAQILEGGDFICPGTVIPDRCAFKDVLDAINICSSMATCRSVVHYHNGTSGCSDPVAVLTTAWPTGNNSYVAPTADVLTKNSDRAVRGEWWQSCSVLVPCLGVVGTRPPPAPPSPLPACCELNSACLVFDFRRCQCC